MIKHIQNVLFRADAHMWPTMAVWQTATPEKLAAELDSIDITSNEDLEQKRDRIQRQLLELRKELNGAAEASRLAKLETEITQQTEALKQAVADHKQTEEAMIAKAGTPEVVTGGKKAYIGTRRGSLNVRILNSDGDTVNTTPDGARWKLPRNTEVIDLGERKPGDPNARYKGEWAKISFKEPGGDTPIHAWVAASYLVDRPGKAGGSVPKAGPEAVNTDAAAKKAGTEEKAAETKVQKLEKELSIIDKDSDPDAYEAKEKEIEAAKEQLKKAREKKEALQAAPAKGAERGREVVFEGVTDEEKELPAYSDLQDLAAKLDPSITVIKAKREITDEGKLSFSLELKLANKTTVKAYTDEGHEGVWYVDHIGADGTAIEPSMYTTAEGQGFISSRSAANFLRNAGYFSTNETWEEEKKKEEVPSGLSLMNEVAAKVLRYTPKAKILAEKGSADTNVYYNLAFEVKGRLFVATVVSTDAKASNNQYSIYLEEMAAKEDAKITDAKGNVDFSKLTGTGQLQPVKSDIASTLELTDGKFTVDVDTNGNFGTFESVLLEGKFSTLGEGLKPVDREKEEFQKLAKFDTVLSPNRGLTKIGYVKVGEKPTLQFTKEGRTFKLEFVSADKGVLMTEIDAQGKAVDKGVSGENVESEDVGKLALTLKKGMKDEGLQVNDFNEDNFPEIYTTIPKEYLSKLQGVTDLKVTATTGNSWERTKSDGTKETVEGKRYYHLNFKVGSQEWTIFADNATEGTFYYEKKVGNDWKPGNDGDGVLSPRPGEASTINSLEDVDWVKTFGAEAAPAAAPAKPAETANEVTIDGEAAKKIKASRDAVVLPSANPEFTEIMEIKFENGKTLITTKYKKGMVLVDDPQVIDVDGDIFTPEQKASQEKLKAAVMTVLNEE